MLIDYVNCFNLLISSIKTEAQTKLIGMPYNVIYTVVEDMVKLIVSPNCILNLKVLAHVATLNLMAVEMVSKPSKISAISATRSMVLVVWRSSEINSKVTLSQ